MKTDNHPPDNLVIYEVKGVPENPDVPVPGPGFLGLWIEGDYTFFFFDREPEEQAATFFHADKNLEVRYIHRMKYAQWQDGAGFTPFKVHQLLIAPAWEEGHAAEPGQVMIKIDPGLAFGFGGHPTTRACLEFLTRIYREDRPELMLDLGTGTGVLALAAVKLGAKRALGVEWSHLACDAAKRNVTLNQMDESVAIVRGRAEDYLHFPAPLVCANLHWPVQEAVFESGGFKNRRWLVLSGLFHLQAEELERRLKLSGFKVADRIRDSRWCSLLMRAV